MSCKKYILTNTGATTINFNYMNCEDNQYLFQVDLLPQQTKNIWFVNGTFQMSNYFSQSLVISEDVVFPPTPTPSQTPPSTPNITPTPTQTPTTSPTASATPTTTPTPSVTPTNTNTPTVSPTNTSSPTPTPTNTPTISLTPSETPTNTPTTSQTATPTETPTNTPTNTGTPTPTPTSVRFSFSVGSGATQNDACDAPTTGTIWGNDSIFDECTQFYPNSSGPSTMLAGFYSNGTIVTEIGSDGSQLGSYSLCSVVPTQTPTPTITASQTPTPSITPSNTPTTTTTPSPTPTFGYYTYTLGTGLTSSVACSNFSSSPQTIYGTVSGGPGPNLGEFLYLTPGNPPTNPAPNGYYSDGTAFYQVTGGSGEITTSDPNGC